MFLGLAIQCAALTGASDIHRQSTCDDVLGHPHEDTRPFDSLQGSQDDVHLASVIAALEYHYANVHRGVARTTVIRAGGESLVLKVVFQDGTVQAVKTPKRFHIRRSVHAWAAEEKIIAKARRQDREGGRYLIKQHRFEVAHDERNFLFNSMAFSSLGSLDRILTTHLGPKNLKKDMAQFLRLFRQMCLAVRALHNTGAVHRDIKPANFLVFKRRSGLSVRLIDFTIASRVGQLPISMESSISGTLTHMSDNQLKGLPAQFADDIHGLLITYAEMLIGASIWQLDAQDPANHIDLVFLQGMTNQYPRLRALPDPIAAAIPKAFGDLYRGSYRRVDDLILAVDALASRPL